MDVAYSQIRNLLGINGGLLGVDITEVRPGIGTGTPAHDDTGIIDLTPTVNLPVAATFPSTNYVKFHAEWALGQSSSENVTELGLFFSNGNLCSRLSFSAMTKSAIWLWEIDWTLYFNVSYV